MFAGLIFFNFFSMAVLEIMGNPLSWGDYGGRVIHAATELNLYTLD